MVYNSKIIDILKNNNIIVYGIGHVAMKFYKSLVICGLDKNIECFVVTQKTEITDEIDGIKIKSIDDIESDKNTVICIAVHEAIRNEVEEILNKNKILDYIWINPHLLTELVLDEPIKKSVRIPIDNIIKQNRDYRIAIRYLAIENYFGKNTYGYDIYKRAQELYCGQKTAESRLASFCNLIHNWELYGYQSDYAILIDESFRLIDGAHRITLAKYHQNKGIICSVFRDFQCFSEWLGSAALSTKSIIQNAGFDYEELKIIEDADRRIREISNER